MKYRWHPKTGEEFLLESDDPAEGLVDSPALIEKPEEATEFTDMTRDELKTYLDEHEIKHNKRWGKEKLITACIEG